jgi:hypothetical protein
MEQMPSGDLFANALYFALEVLVYNTTTAQKLLFLIPKAWAKKTIHTMRCADLGSREGSKTWKEAYPQAGHELRKIQPLSLYATEVRGSYMGYKQGSFQRYLTKMGECV